MSMQLFRRIMNRNKRSALEGKSTTASASGSPAISAENVHKGESDEDVGEERMRGVKQQEYPYLTPSTGWTFKKAPSPDKPLLTRDGRIPKVAIAVITSIGVYWDLKWKLNTLFSRLRYLDSLFEGCDVDRLMRCGTYDQIPNDVKKDWSNELERWKLFNYLFSSYDFFDYIYKHKYDFVLFMNIFPDKAVAGMAYGLVETTYERYTLRACMLSSGGNAMFGDWGIPSDYPYTKVNDDMNDIALASFYDEPVYRGRQLSRDIHAFAKTWRNKQRPFARLVRLGKYIRPIEIGKDELPDKVIKRIYSAVRGEAFSRANLWATWWASFNGLLFPYDFIDVSLYYVWKNHPRIQKIQEYIANCYLDFVDWYYNSFEEEKMRALLLIVDTFIWWITRLLIGYVMWMVWDIFRTWRVEQQANVSEEQII